MSPELLLDLLGFLGHRVAAVSANSEGNMVRGGGRGREDEGREGNMVKRGRMKGGRGI